MNRSTCYTLLAAVLIGPALMAQSVTVTPANESVVVGMTRQYTATATGLANTAVTWYAGGVAGGNSTVGIISSTGLYTAPSVQPGQNPVQITARSVTTSTIRGSVYVTILSKGPTITSVSPNPIPLGTVNVTMQGTGFLAGATVIDTYSSYGAVQMSTTSVTATTVKATGYQGTGAAAVFMVRNAGSGFSNTLSVPIVSSGPSKYTLSVVGGTGAGSYSAGAVVPLTATPGPGQIFQSWIGAAVANPNAASTTLTMPAANTTVTANYTSGPTYTLTVNGGSGSGPYGAGAVVAITANAAPAGQVFQNWTGAIVANANAASTTLTMPTAATSVTSSYAPIAVPTLTSVSPATVPIGVFTLAITGTNFQAGLVAVLAGKSLSTQFVSATQLTATGFNSTSGPSTLVVSNGSVASAPYSLQLGPANALVTVNAARHFLQQAAFGPTAADAANVQTLGFQGWLSQQFAAPKVSNYATIGSQSSFTPQFLTNAVNNPDQLRQRVAFALSQITVTSVTKNIWTTTTAPFEEMLMTDAFSNFRQILNDVTLSPTMGQFLDMANNSKANANNTILPNENYAREVMQLFTVGTVQLNPDGSKQLDASNNPIPTYDQSTVANFAKVFTGWTYAPPAGGSVNWGAYINPSAPMVPYAPMHDATAKTLLQYTAPAGVFTALPAGQSAQNDLTEALDNIFNHPNVGPFISKQLIQHLVKSNPTPGYVQRVAAVFNNNGLGVRGDMRAVVSTILLDAEARQNDQPSMTQAKDGHLQEPILFLAGFLRAMGAYVDNTNYFGYDLVNQNQDIYNAPSVFNYFSPGYQVPTFGIGGPEFQIYTPYSSVYRDNLVSSVFGAYSNVINSYGPGTTIDLSPFVALAANPQTLTDALDLTLTNGLAPAGLKNIILNAIAAENGGNLRRVQTGLYLMLASSYYNVWN
jgi:uncharacterized protein (DUF1800 family)